MSEAAERIGRRLHDAAVPALTAQMLEWIAAKPRSYAETMEAWRTSCPRLSVWEDACENGLIRLDRSAGASTPEMRVHLSQAGIIALSGNGLPQTSGPAGNASVAVPVGTQSAWRRGEDWITGAIRLIWAARRISDAVSQRRQPAAADLLSVGVAFTGEPAGSRDPGPEPEIAPAPSRQHGPLLPAGVAHGAARL